MTLPRVHVQMSRQTPGRGRVTVDGRPLPGVRTVAVRHGVDEPASVSLELRALEATVEYVDRLDDHQEVSDDGTAQ